MGEQLDIQLRGPAAYGLARLALEQMEASKVWPTPLNFELWLLVVGEPDGPLGREVRRLLDSGEPITDTLSEELASQFLPRLRFTEEIRDAGDQLSRQLDSISMAIDTAQRSSAAYGRTLAGATKELAQEAQPESLKRLVSSLGDAHAARAARERQPGKASRRVDPGGPPAARAPGAGAPRRHDGRPDQPRQPQGLRRGAGSRLRRGRDRHGDPGDDRHRPLQALQRHLGAPDRRPGDPLRRQRDRPHGRPAAPRLALRRRGVRHPVPHRARRTGGPRA